MASDSPKIEVWCIGMKEEALKLLSKTLEPTHLTPMLFDIEKLMEATEPTPTIILCGEPPPDIQAAEVAQMLRMQHQTQPIYYVTLNRTNYNRELFVKNGFSDSFLLPLDTSLIHKVITEYFTKISSGAIRSYRPVKIIDVSPGEALDFDTSVFLPTNKKYVKLSHAGDDLDGERLEKLKKHNMNNLYVATEQMQNFYKYTAEKLAKIGKSNTISETEKKEKMETAVRDLMSGLFNDTSKEATFEQGQELVSDCRHIVNNFIFTSDKGEWYKQLLNTMGEQGTSYSHLANVSTYAALFSIGLGIGDPAELATAGLLHDLGLADIPYEIVSKPASARTREGQALYEKHPEMTINILKARKFIMSDKLIKMILQHHERFNGTGYPNKLYGDRILKEAQVLALADEFDYLTAAQDGRPLMSPAQAVEHFRQQIANNPADMLFNPDLLKGLLKLFPSGT